VDQYCPCRFPHVGYLLSCTLNGLIVLLEIGVHLLLLFIGMLDYLVPLTDSFLSLSDDRVKFASNSVEIYLPRLFPLILCYSEGVRVSLIVSFKGARSMCLGFAVVEMAAWMTAIGEHRQRITTKQHPVCIEPYRDTHSPLNLY
jgi:hypothetical protein